MDDWYNVNIEDIYKNGGGGLLGHYYNSSPSLALQSVYPEHKWDLAKCFRTSRHNCGTRMMHKRKTVFKANTQQSNGQHLMDFGRHKENHMKFFDWSYVRLAYNSMEDWYNVSVSDIHKNGGRGSLMHITKVLLLWQFRLYTQSMSGKLDKFKHKPEKLWNKNNVQRLLFS